MQYEYSHSDTSTFESCLTKSAHALDALAEPTWQPVQLLAAIPLPVGNALEPPAKVAQLAMLEQRGTSGPLRMAKEVERTVYFHGNLLPILQSHERVDAIPGGLATMLFLHTGPARTDLSYNIGLQL